MKYIKIMFLLLMINNSYAYCSFWQKTCEIQVNDDELKKGIAGAFATERDRAINDAIIEQGSYNIYKTSNEVDTSVITVNNGISIDDFVQLLYTEFIKNAIVEDKDTYILIYVKNLDVCIGKYPLSISKLGDDYKFNQENCLYSQVSKAVKNDAYNKHMNEIQKSKVIAQSKRDKYNVCREKYNNSSEYLNYIKKRDAFINKRYRNCINNGYDSMTCYSYKLSDKVGYGLEHRAPLNQCKF